MAEINIAHREIIDGISRLTEYGQGRVAAALFGADKDGNLRASHAEIGEAVSAILADRQLDASERADIAGLVQSAFTRLGSPKTCAAGLPHQRIIQNVRGLTEYGQGRVAVGLYAADRNADLCVTRDELRNAVRAVRADRLVDATERSDMAGRLQLAYTRLKPPSAAARGVTLHPATK